MNLSCLVAADVRRLTLSERVLREKDQSLVTRLRPTGYGGQASAATSDWVEFIVPMCVQKLGVLATHVYPFQAALNRSSWLT